jgi:hypothetical protein
VKKGVRFERWSFPHPWEDVAIFVQWYFTREGRYGVVYVQHIRLLDHLQHNRPINMPYLFFWTLQTMVSLVQRENNPKEVVSQHGLIKFLVKHALHKEGRTWNIII